MDTVSRDQSRVVKSMVDLCLRWAVNCAVWTPTRLVGTRIDRFPRIVRTRFMFRSGHEQWRLSSWKKRSASEDSCLVETQS